MCCTAKWLHLQKENLFGIDEIHTPASSAGTLIIIMAISIEGPVGCKAKSIILNTFVEI